MRYVVILLAVLLLGACQGGLEFEPSVGVEAGVGGANVAHIRATGPRLSASGDGLFIGVQPSSDPQDRAALNQHSSSLSFLGWAVIAFVGFLLIGGIVALIVWIRRN